jgi:hypothetical protein
VRAVLSPSGIFAFDIFFAAWDAKKTPTLRDGKRQLCPPLYEIAGTFD